MKRGLNIIFTILLTLLSLPGYYNLLLIIYLTSVPGIFTPTYEDLIMLNTVIFPIIAIILSILTGYFYNHFRKRGLKKTRLIFVIVQLALFTFAIYWIIQAFTPGNMVPIYEVKTKY